MLIGDHLVSARCGYTHHGLYLGGGMVIHYSGLADGLSSGPIEITTMNAFSGGGSVSISPHPRALHNLAQRLARAMSRLGENRYNLITNNCEHFVNWCIDGISVSEQVNRGWRIVAMTAATASPIAGVLVGGVGAVITAKKAALSSDQSV